MNMHYILCEIHVKYIHILDNLINIEEQKCTYLISILFSIFIRGCELVKISVI